MTSRVPGGRLGALRAQAGEKRLRLELIRHHFRGSRESLLLGAAVVLPRVTGLLTLPIYTRLLGVEDFGRYELLISIMALLYAGCLVGLDFAIAVRYFGQDEQARRRDVASALGAAAVSSTVTAGVLAAFAGVIGPQVLESPSGGFLFAIAVAAVPFNVLGGVLSVYLRLRFDGVGFFRATLGGAIVGTAVGLVLVLGAGWGLMGAIVGLAAVHIITFALLTASVRTLVNPSHADRATAFRLIRLGAPIVPASAASWILALADRFFLVGYLGFVQLGLYASAARLATVLAMIQFGFHAAWGPLALRWASMADRDRRYAASLRLVAVTGGAATAIVAWLAEPLVWLVAGPAYVTASDVVWALAGGALFSAMFFVVQIGANLAQRGSRVAGAMVIAAIANTAGNIALIPRIGYLGAGIATLTTYIVAYVVMYAMSHEVTPIRMSFGRSTAWAIAWTAIAAASRVVPAEARLPVTGIVIGIAVAVGLAAVIQFTSVLSGPIHETPQRDSGDDAAPGVAEI